ncbi:MAG: YvcK family protein [Acidobacteriota bacterium]|nr:YvcK family protein [Acidobacteriota bacterium]
MRLRSLRVGCFGGGTGLPSLLGGLRSVPWLDLNAIVTMFDSGGSSGQLRDELGVLPPGDILKCALALARNEREARRLLLSRLPSLDSSTLRAPGPLRGHERLRGHTGGNLLLSMMAQYSGDFVAGVEGLQSLLGCVGRVWPISTEPATVCAEYHDGHVIRGEVEVDAGQLMGRPVRRVWLEPEVDIHPAVAQAIGSFDAAIIGPGSFYTSLMPILLVRGAREAFASVNGPVVFVANLLSEGQGMEGMTAAGAAALIEDAIGRPVDVIVFNTGRPAEEALLRYAAERKAPLELGDVRAGCELVTGNFWRGDIARHDRRRLGTAVWAALAGRLLTET